LNKAMSGNSPSRIAAVFSPMPGIDVNKSIFSSSSAGCRSIWS
jgi:hypothetical protein